VLRKKQGGQCTSVSGSFAGAAAEERGQHSGTMGDEVTK
jgi:hypothetical protein